MKVNSDKWTHVVDELLTENPRLDIVKAQMKLLGLKPGKSVDDCLEKIWRELEFQEDKKVPSRLKGKVHEL